MIKFYTLEEIKEQFETIEDLTYNVAWRTDPSIFGNIEDECKFAHIIKNRYSVVNRVKILQFVNGAIDCKKEDTPKSKKQYDIYIIDIYDELAPIEEYVKNDRTVIENNIIKYENRTLKEHELDEYKSKYHLPIELFRDIVIFDSLIRMYNRDWKYRRNDYTDTIKKDIRKSQYDWDKALIFYEFWNTIRDKKANIFSGCSESDFIGILDFADFSTLKKNNGNNNRIKGAIAFLERYIIEHGDDWGERAAKSIGVDLIECNKRTKFPEYKKLKDLYIKKPEELSE